MKTSQRHFSLDLRCPPPARRDPRLEAGTRLVEKLAGVPLRTEMTQYGKFNAIDNLTELVDRVLYGNYGTEHRLIVVEGPGQETVVWIAGGNPEYLRGYRPEDVSYSDLHFAAYLVHEGTLELLDALLELGDRMQAWHGVGMVFPEDQALSVSPLILPTRRPSRLGWLNYWSAEVAQAFDFPDPSRDKPWLAHARTSATTGAWAVALTEAPFESAAPGHLAVIEEARQRFPTRGTQGGRRP